MRDAIGWLSSLILLMTLSAQVYKQWKEETSKGVSKWLYIGQITADVGFLIYSWLLGSWVFVVTNILLIVSCFTGLAIVYRHRRRAQRASRDNKLQNPRAA